MTAKNHHIQGQFNQICWKRKRTKVQYNFEWDPEKAKTNIKKHKVNFEHAATIFKDPQALSIFDDAHSENEDRWVSIGLASNGILLVVHHTYKPINDQAVVIRIISSRKATRNEERQYMEGLK